MLSKDIQAHISEEVIKISNKEFSRVKIVAIMFIVLLLSFIISFLYPLDKKTAYLLSKESKEEIEKEINGKSVHEMAISISLHNFMISLLMIVPLLGVFLGAAIMINTGIVANALIISQGISSTMGKIFISLGLLFQPFTLLEIFSYSLMTSESYFLFKAIKKKKYNELLITILIIVLSYSILLLAGTIEAIEIIRNIRLPLNT